MIKTWEARKILVDSNTCLFCAVGIFQGPVHTNADIFENWFFFSVVAFRPQGNDVYRYQNARFQKRSLGWRFLKTLSYIIQRMSCKEFNCMSIVLAFSCTTVRWDAYFLKTKKKISVFKNIHVWFIQEPYPRRAEYLLIISYSAQCNNVKVVKSR